MDTEATETRERKLWGELIAEAETACGGNKDQVIGWLAAKLARAQIAEEDRQKARLQRVTTG